MNEASTTQNFRDISPRALKLLVIGAGCCALAFGAVSLRLWARRIKGCRLCFNDYAILAAWVQRHKGIIRFNANILQDVRCRRLCDSHIVSVHFGSFGILSLLI